MTKYLKKVTGMLCLNNDIESDKCIYVAFLTAPTKIGRAIRFITKNKYSHVALSFEEDLGTMYSFARYRVNAPLVAGFVEESALRYYYFNQTDIPVKICRIPLTDEKFKEVSDYIRTIELNSKQYIYNLLALASASIHKKVPIDKSYTCLEFVYSVLYNCGIETSIDIEKYFTISELEDVLAQYVIFEGSLKKPLASNDWGNDLFYSKKSMPRVIGGTIKQCGVLLKRTFIS